MIVEQLGCQTLYTPFHYGVCLLAWRTYEVLVYCRMVSSVRSLLSTYSNPHHLTCLRYFVTIVTDLSLSNKLMKALRKEQ